MCNQTINENQDNRGEINSDFKVIFQMSRLFLFLSFFLVHLNIFVFEFFHIPTIIFFLLLNQDFSAKIKGYQIKYIILTQCMQTNLPLELNYFSWEVGSPSSKLKINLGLFKPNLFSPHLKTQGLKPMSSFEPRVLLG